MIEEYLKQAHKLVQETTRVIPETDKRLNSISFGGMTSAWLKAETERNKEVAAQMQVCLKDLPPEFKKLLTAFELAMHYIDGRIKWGYENDRDANWAIDTKSEITKILDSKSESGDQNG